MDWSISRGIVAYHTTLRKISSNCHGDYQRTNLGMIPDEEKDDVMCLKFVLVYFKHETFGCCEKNFCKKFIDQRQISN